jgi:hypothetical protein
MLDPNGIRKRIVEAATSEAGLSSKVAEDVAFHLTDWLDDLSSFAEFLRNPELLSAEGVDSMLLSFLQHVPNHLAAAAKLYADSPVRDVFCVGAVETNDAA